MSTLNYQALVAGAILLLLGCVLTYAQRRLARVLQSRDLADVAVLRFLFEKARTAEEFDRFAREAITGVRRRARAAALMDYLAGTFFMARFAADGRLQTFDYAGFIICALYSAYLLVMIPSLLSSRT